MNSSKMSTIGCDLFILEVVFFFIPTVNKVKCCRYNEHRVCRPADSMLVFFSSFTTFQQHCHICLFVIVVYLEGMVKAKANKRLKSSRHLLYATCRLNYQLDI